MAARAKTARVKIRGQTWRIVVKKLPPRRVGKDYLSMHGECEYETRTIYLNPDFNPHRTLLHEVLHAALPDLEELTILQVEEALADGLAALTRITTRSTKDHASGSKP